MADRAAAGAGVRAAAPAASGVDVAVALDFPSAAEALALVERLGDAADLYKVGLELFGREGPAIVRELRARERRVFLDLKLHDIPNTVSGAVRGALEEGVDYLTVHALGGPGMLRAAADAAEDRVRLLAVTLLTSLSVSEMETTFGRELLSVRDEVVRLAEMARDAGVPGAVAAPLEVEALKRRLGRDFLVAAPGIRLAGDETHDQSRVATPRMAVEAGADLLVVGRSVSQAEDPVRALARVREDAAGPGDEVETESEEGTETRGVDA